MSKNQFTTDYYDIVGSKLGELQVDKFLGFNIFTHKPEYHCICSCGKECVFPRHSLVNGDNRSCGHLQYQLKERYEGRRFGRLTVIERDYSKNKNYVWYRCRCDCGNECIVSAINLKIGKTKSCGCYARDRAKEGAHHGFLSMESKKDPVKRKFYSIWRNIKNRCYCKSDHHYHIYGARGIRVCDRWLSFENFYEDMYDKFLDAVEKWGLKAVSIDRIDVDGNYEPSNCRFANGKMQARNKSDTRYVTVYGQTIPQMDAYELYAVSELSYSGFNDRINRGMDIYDALFTKPDPRYSRNKYDPNAAVKPLIFFKPGAPICPLVFFNPEDKND